jgi:16S rRNA (cytosine1402-N4)-methyltransferase
MHKPVMVREVLEYLNPPVGGVVVDATVGAGGHARAFAERVGREGTLIALDRDAQMLALAQQNLADIACIPPAAGRRRGSARAGQCPSSGAS